jgi:hypothetical protein
MLRLRVQGTPIEAVPLSHTISEVFREILAVDLMRVTAAVNTLDPALPRVTAPADGESDWKGLESFYERTAS